jgi:hypothetical protein
MGFLIYDVDLVGELIEYGRARLGASVDQVSKTLMEATFAETMKIYHNFSQIFRFQTATVATLLNKPGAIGGSDRIGYLDAVRIHKVLLTKVRNWFRNPAHWKRTKYDVLTSMGMITAGASAPAPAAAATSTGGKDPNAHIPEMKEFKFGGFFRPYPADVLEINQNLGYGSALKIAKGTVSGWFGVKQGGQILKPKLIDLTPDETKTPEKRDEKQRKLGMDNTEPTLLDYDGFFAFMGDVFPEFTRQHKKEVEDLFHYYRGIPDSKKLTGREYGQNSAKTAAKQEGAFLSIIELLTSMAIVSSGSVCEKALLLFHIYAGKGDGDPIEAGYYPHARPPSVESTVKRMDDVKSAAQIGKLPICHDEKGDVSALLFILRTNFDSRDRKQKQKLTTAIPGKDPPIVFGLCSIKEFGQIRREASGDPVRAQLAVYGNLDASDIGEKPDKKSHFANRDKLYNIGTLSVEVKYIQLLAPSEKHDGCSFGRLEVSVKSFWFTHTPQGVTQNDIRLFNPQVQVKTFTPSSSKATVKEVGAWAVKDIPHSLTEKRMMWPEPEGVSGGSQNSGFRNNVFVWNPAKVKKTSYGEMKFPGQLLRAAAGNDKMISMQAVRLICISIFQRCMYPMTSRQAIAFADSAFSRSRIAPCFTDAIVLKGDAPTGGLSAIYKGPEKDSKTTYSYTDVLSYINMAWDKALNQNSGQIDLWLWESHDMPAKPTLKDLINYDPYRGAGSTLILRGRRAGDGDWFEYSLKFNPSLIKVSYGGKASRDLVMSTPPAKDTPLVPLDVDNDVQHLKWLSKEEFMSGMAGAPVLAESLRRMTSADTQTKDSKVASLTVKVDTGMGDTEFAGFVQVGKKILLEVWDHKGTGRNEFLGEVYINDLEECREMYEGSVPLQPATTESIKRDVFKGYHQDSQKVWAPPGTRDQRDKATEWATGMYGTKDKTTPESVQGELSVSARWVFPEPVPEGHITTKDRPTEDVKKQDEYDDEIEKTRNTGRLSLSVRRATGLKSHSGGIASADTANPYVKIWVYNEEGKKWRLVTKTNTATKTTDPVWSEMFEIRIILDRTSPAWTDSESSPARGIQP